MHKYFIKTPWWARTLFSSYIWRIPSNEKKVYLSFDDGPHPTITPWVLNELKNYNAKASFFCIGANVEKHSKIYEEVIEEGHAIGNHTYHHLNGWKTSATEYLKDVESASSLIHTSLFRPPYGRITFKQAKGIKDALKNTHAKVIMWDVLSADFDRTISPEQCVENVLKNVSAGSIIVFHDSEKAFPNLKHALPIVLNSLNKEGYRFDKIVMDSV